MPAETVPKQERSAETRRRLLDAAVDELVEGGYARFTTLAVAERARISRGAQQYHFPHKTDLVAAAVRHLADRNLGALYERAAPGRGRRASVLRTLDLVFEQYTGPLFAAMLELSLAARGDEALGRVIAREEKAISRGIDEWANELLAGEGDVADFEQRLAITMSTIRGIAVLELLGHPPASVRRQWRFTRTRLAELLAG